MLPTYPNRSSGSQDFPDPGVAPVVQQALPPESMSERLDHGRIGLHRDRLDA
jgi:hypothetical protein